MSSDKHNQTHDTQKPSVLSANHKAHHVFSNAQKHSRRVKKLKIILPIIAAIVALIFAWFTFFAAPSTDNVITLNDEAGQSNKLVMNAPKIEGYTNDNRPYNVTAQRAVQDPEKSGIIELENIAGRVPLGSHGDADINASKALYDNINGRLVFQKPFTVVTTTGINAKLKSADINLQSGQMASFDPVEIESATQKLNASFMRVTENGKVIDFGGRVHIVINGDTNRAGDTKQPN